MLKKYVHKICSSYLSFCYVTKASLTVFEQGFVLFLSPYFFIFLIFGWGEGERGGCLAELFRNALFVLFGNVLFLLFGTALFVLFRYALFVLFGNVL